MEEGLTMILSSGFFRTTPEGEASKICPCLCIQQQNVSLNSSVKFGVPRAKQTKHLDVHTFHIFQPYYFPALHSTLDQCFLPLGYAFLGKEPDSQLACDDPTCEVVIDEQDVSFV